MTRCVLVTDNVLLQVCANAHLDGAVLSVMYHSAMAWLQVLGPAATEDSVRQQAHANAQQGTQAQNARILFVRVAALMMASVLHLTHASVRKDGVGTVAARLFVVGLPLRLVPALRMGVVHHQRIVPAK